MCGVWCVCVFVCYMCGCVPAYKVAGLLAAYLFGNQPCGQAGPRERAQRVFVAPGYRKAPLELAQRKDLPKQGSVLGSPG